MAVLVSFPIIDWNYEWEFTKQSLTIFISVLPIGKANGWQSQPLCEFSTTLWLSYLFGKKGKVGKESVVLFVSLFVLKDAIFET